MKEENCHLPLNTLEVDSARMWGLQQWEEKWIWLPLLHLHLWLGTGFSGLIKRSSYLCTSPSLAPRTTGTLLLQEHVQRCPPHSWARNRNGPWFATQVFCWMLPSIDYRQPRWWHELSSASVAILSGRQISGASLLSIKFWTRFSRSLTWGRNSLFSRWDWCQGTVTSS